MKFDLCHFKFKVKNPSFGDQKHVIDARNLYRTAALTELYIVVSIYHALRKRIAVHDRSSVPGKVSIAPL